MQFCFVGWLDVSVDAIKALTGPDFFRGLETADDMEAMDTWQNLQALPERPL